MPRYRKKPHVKICPYALTGLIQAKTLRLLTAVFATFGRIGRIILLFIPPGNLYDPPAFRSGPLAGLTPLRIPGGFLYKLTSLPFVLLLSGYAPIALAGPELNNVDNFKYSKLQSKHYLLFNY